jgi:hypothetical protein
MGGCTSSIDRGSAARLSIAAIVAGLVVWCAPWTASANGRFPRATRLIEDPRDPLHLVLAATYGIVITADRGRNWHHVCEASFAGFEPYVGDPILDLTGDGALLVDVQSALNLSVDNGCAWYPAFGGAGHYLPDFTIADDANRSILAMDATSEEMAVVSRLIESTDHGGSFHARGTPPPVGIALTLDVANSDPDRIYVSGLSTANAAVLAISADRGETWSARPIPLGADELPYIAAVDPRDPNKLFLRVASIADRDGVPTANDALWATHDAGASWREVFRADAHALGFALSPDGETVLLGYGDPRADVAVDPSVLGIYRSSATSFEFSRLSTTSTTCLAWTANGIYVCTSQFETGHALAFVPAERLSPDGRGLEPLLDLRDVRGPLVCCGGAANQRCAANWPTTCAVLGACVDSGSGVDGGACALDGGSTARQDAGSTDGPSSEEDDAGIGPPNQTSDGCACRTTPMQCEESGAWFAAVFAAIATARWWRRLRSRPNC